MSSRFSLSRTFIVAISILMGILVILEYANLSLFFANISQNIHWYIGKNENIRRYNESLFLAQDGDYASAKSLLFGIINKKELKNQSDVFELYGDLVYKTGGATGDVLTFYKRALSYKENLRIEQKISMIEHPDDTEGSGSTSTGTEEKIKETSISFASGSDTREEKKKELELIQQNRKGMINFSPQGSDHLRKEVQGLFNILDGGAEKRDW